MSTFHSLGRRLQGLFIAGMLTLLPIWLTWVVVKFVFVVLSGLSRPLIDPILQTLAISAPGALSWLAQAWVKTAIGLVATLAVILFAGWLTRRMLGQRLLGWFETPKERPAR